MQARALSQGQESKPVPLLQVSEGIFTGGNGEVSSGDRDMLSTVIGLYAYEARMPLQARYVEFLLATVESLLVKTGRYKDYKDDMEACINYYQQFCSKLESPGEKDTCRIMKFRLERTLRAIAERENFTKNSREAFTGHLNLPPGSIMGEESPPIN